MKQFKKPMAYVLCAVLFPVNSVIAEDNWWDVGVNIFNSVGAERALSEEIDTGEIAEAFKEALRIGSENVVNQLGGVNGFNSDSAIHIPLPKELQTVKAMLAQVGMSQIAEDLELKLNRAAEAATPKAKALFLQSISDMTFDDVKKIYAGSNDSATQYFQQKMSPLLSKEMAPIIQSKLSEVGAIQAYDNVMGQYQSLPFMPDVKANLTDHVVQKGMDGIFHYLAKEEAAIRENPLKQSTALLKKVFGNK